MNVSDFKQAGIKDKGQLHAFRVSERIRLLRKFHKLLYLAFIELGEDKFEILLRSASKQKTTSECELKRVSNYIGIPVDELQQKTRRREVVESRQVAMYLAKQNTKESLARIGRTIGGKDHATVIHACRTVTNLIQTDKSFRNKWRTLIEV